MSSESRRIFVTGASGVVGAALLAELEATSTAVCLVHRVRPSGENVDIVRGDLTRRYFGLDPARFAELARSIDAIVHCAALTDFTADPSDIARLNLAGTDHALELAAAADVPLYHLSTAFIARLDRAKDGNGTNSYLSSKKAGEARVANSGLPAVIVRPSIVMGDSASGAIAHFQGLHALAGAFFRNSLPILPLGGQTRIDFVPQDAVAKTIAALVRQEERAGEYWVTGGENALRTGRMMELSEALAETAGLRLQRPRLVDQDFIDRLLRPVFLQDLPVEGGRRFEQMLQMTQLCAEEPLPSSLTQLADQFSVDQELSADGLETTFVNSMRFWMLQKGLLDRAGVSP
jgi:thioester reductase-like protein